MSRYRALTMRWPHLTEAEEAERQQLALAGWHEALTLGVGACTCQRQPGEEDPRVPCAECAAEEAQESLGMTTIGAVLAGGGTHDFRRDRLAAALDDDADCAAQ